MCEAERLRSNGSGPPDYRAHGRGLRHALDHIRTMRPSSPTGGSHICPHARPTTRPPTARVARQEFVCASDCVTLTRLRLLGKKKLIVVIGHSCGDIRGLHRGRPWIRFGIGAHARDRLDIRRASRCSIFRAATRHDSGRWFALVNAMLYVNLLFVCLCLCLEFARGLASALVLIASMAT